MKKVIYTAIIIAIQHLTLSTQHSFAQAPLNTPDNIASGNCLDFDGVNNIVTMGDITAGVFDNSATQLTLEAWINPSDITSNHMIASKYNSNICSERAMYFGIIPTGKLRIFTGSAVCNQHKLATTTNQVFNTGQWYHVAATVNLTTQQMKLYVDGKEQSVSLAGNAFPANFINGNQAFEFGVIHNTNAPTEQYFNGKIDEVRMWNIVLSETEIRDNMCTTLQGNETGLVGYWNMNEGTGNTVSDLTSNGIDGTRQ